MLVKYGHTSVCGCVCKGTQGYCLYYDTYLLCVFESKITIEHLCVEVTYNAIEHLKQLKKHMKFTTPSLVGWMLGFCGCSIFSHDDARVVATE